MTEADGPGEKAEEIAEKLRGLKWFRVDFALYGSVEVRARNRDEAERKAYENYDWKEHVDGGEVTLLEEEQ